MIVKIELKGGRQAWVNTDHVSKIESGTGSDTLTMSDGRSLTLESAEQTARHLQTEELSRDVGNRQLSFFKPINVKVI